MYEVSIASALYCMPFHLTWPGQICFLYDVYIHVQQGKTKIDIRAIRNIDFGLSKCACSVKLKGALCTATHSKFIWGAWSDVAIAKIENRHITNDISELTSSNQKIHFIGILRTNLCD